MDGSEFGIVPVTIDAHVLTISQAQRVRIESDRRLGHELQQIFFETLAQRELSLITQLEVLSHVVRIDSDEGIVEEVKAAVKYAKYKVGRVIVIGQLDLALQRLVLVVVVGDELRVLQREHEAELSDAVDSASANDEQSH